MLCLPEADEGAEAGHAAAGAGGPGSGLRCALEAAAGAGVHGVALALAGLGGGWAEGRALGELSFRATA
jgi:hypothetical protein